MQKYDLSLALATMARDRYGADWIIQCDADEFLCLDKGLKATLQDAKNADLTVVRVPCFNVTGPLLQPGQRAQGTLTLRIDKPVKVLPEHTRSDDLPVPHIFMEFPPKTIVWAAALTQYGPGTHDAQCSSGQKGEVPGLRFLHFPVRGYDKFEKKIQNTAAWLEDNPHLSPRWGWHWRRFIRMHRLGRLREDYESQFVTPAKADELVANGTCSFDDTVADWYRRRA